MAKKAKNAEDDEKIKDKKNKLEKAEHQKNSKNKPPETAAVFFEEAVPTNLYVFSRASLWKRPNQGPLVTPTYNIAKASGMKELYLGSDWLEYMQKTNSPVAYGRIIADDWGPSKGINDKGKMIFNTVVYPGRNVVRIIQVVNGKDDDTKWGLVDTLDENIIPDSSINVYDTPQYVHTVYGSGKNETWLILDKDAPVVPLLGAGGRWIQMEWLDKIELPKAVTITTASGVPVCAQPGDLTTKNADNLAENKKVVIGELRIAKGGIWGRTETGWIALRYNDANQTDWVI